jgi:hypothetical protein
VPSAIEAVQRSMMSQPWRAISMQVAMLPVSP